MKCISLWQPWASVVAVGMKRAETRSWSTGYRGLVAIHAAKKKPGSIIGMCQMFRSGWNWWAPGLQAAGCQVIEEGRGIRLHTLPLGAIVAVAELVDCQSTTCMVDAPARERYLGDFTAGRFAWWLGRTVRLDEPIPFRGQQGLFDLPTGIADRLRGAFEGGEDVSRKWPADRAVRSVAVAE